MRPYNDVQKCKLTFRETGKIFFKSNTFLGEKTYLEKNILFLDIDRYERTKNSGKRKYFESLNFRFKRDANR